MACPICDKEPDAKYLPFCSKRCADIDLGKWLNESYRIPVEEHEESDTSSDDIQPETRH